MGPYEIQENPYIYIYIYEYYKENQIYGTNSKLENGLMYLYYDFQFDVRYAFTIYTKCSL